MNLDKEKLSLIDWIASLEDETIIERIKFLKEKGPVKDFWDEISDEEKASIERGLKDVQDGRVVSHEVVKKNYEKWL
ncbi:MAG: hypothetical protein K6T54_02810 [Ignavibacterium sp.]|nr:hypothetical protein [Ignavibacterium sp.]